MNTTKKALFICVENSSRIQIAVGFSRTRGINAPTAGTFPLSYVNPSAIEVMKEKEIEISGAKAKAVTEKMVQYADVIVLVDPSLEDSIPKNIWKRCGKNLMIGSISDPRGRPIEMVRFLRDDMERDLKAPLSQKGLS